IAGHEDHGAREVYFAVVAEGEYSFVEDAKKKIPQGIASFLNFVEEYEAKTSVFGEVLIEHFLAQQRMRFAMAQISGRAADKFGNLVAVLEFCAVNFDDGIRALEKAFCRSF